MRRLGPVVGCLAFLAGSVPISAQPSWLIPDGRDRGRRSEREFPTVREVFPGNKFIFARVRYASWGGYWGWATDYPDSDLNFPIRLKELTTIDIEVDESGEPAHVVVDLTNRREMFKYPWLYLIEPGRLIFSEEEARNLREYLLKGGFLHVDDFWGEAEWANFQREFEKVFSPEDYPIRPIPLEHELFHIVFELTEIPQVPSIHHWMSTGLTYERWDAQEPRCLGVSDPNGRLMTVITHNTDLGDGWEREGENQEYFREFSAKKAYPLGINIVVYAMTH